LVQAPDEAGRIGFCGFEHCLVVERDIGSTGFPHFSDKRGFACPARSYDQDHWGIQKGLLRPPLYKPLKYAFPESRTIGTIDFG
jgi:hypothetical protein